MPTGLYLWLKRAEQTATGVAKRLAGESTDQISQEVRHATRRWTGLGLIATTVVLGWSAVATYQALANEASKAIRAVTDSQAIGPWKISAFREGLASAADKESTFGLRLSQAHGHANFRQASLAVAEYSPEDDSQWQIARGGFDEREAKLPLTTNLTGHESLWVSMEAWDGSTYRAQFPLDTFRLNSGSHPTPRQSLGGLPVIFTFGAFFAFSMTIAVPWYWVVWFHRHQPGGGAANRAPRNTTMFK
jgi:hypothetical protein